jgi:hypothetical protein
MQRPEACRRIDAVYAVKHFIRSGTDHKVQWEIGTIKIELVPFLFHTLAHVSLLLGVSLIWYL